MKKGSILSPHPCICFSYHIEKISVSDSRVFLRIRIRAKIFMRIRLLGVKGKDDFFSFFHISDDSEQLLKNLKNKFSPPNCLKWMINTKKHMLLFSLNVKMIQAYFFKVSKAFLKE